MWCLSHLKHVLKFKTFQFQLQPKSTFFRLHGPFISWFSLPFKVFYATYFNRKVINEKVWMQYLTRSSWMYNGKQYNYDLLIWIHENYRNVDLSLRCLCNAAHNRDKPSSLHLCQTDCDYTSLFWGLQIFVHYSEWFK